MAKYMILYNSSVKAKEQMAKASMEEMKTSMDEWIKWRDEAVKSVKFDWGLPLQAVKRITPDGATESDSPVSGHAFMEGEEEEIVELLKTHPHLKNPGASIDVVEKLSMPGIDA